MGEGRLGMEAISQTNYSFAKRRSGKVRDNYDLGNCILMVATDRLSAFDVILPNPIPLKGAVLSQISEFWFKETRKIIPNHFITSNISEYPEQLTQYRELKGRSMLVKKAKPLPIECVVRGYLSGSGWKDYKKSGRVCGLELSEDLKESSKLEQPIFTPATKAETGHDENISFETASGMIGRELAGEVREKSIQLYEHGRDYTLTRGIIIADTKFEFGIFDGQLILIDEVMTPDSSRFWPLADYEEGRSQKSFDKQYVRDYLESINWNKSPPAPFLPQEVVEGTTAKYVEAFERITGGKLLL